MSLRAMTWAYRQATGDPTRKSILITLGDHADDHGRCFPSLRRISQYCEVSRRTAQRHVKVLEDLGLIEIEERTTGSGRQTSHLYRLRLDRDIPIAGLEEGGKGEGDKLTPSPDEDPKGEGDNLTPEGGCQSVQGRVSPVSPPEPPSERGEEEDARSNSSSPTAVAGVDPGLFGEATETVGEFLAARVSGATQRKAFLATLRLWLNGGEPSVWKRQEGGTLPEAERLGILRAALLELLAGDEAGMRGRPGHTRNLRTKIQVLIQARDGPAWRKTGTSMTAEQERKRELDRKATAAQRSRAAKSKEERERAEREQHEAAEVDAYLAGLSKAERRELEDEVNRDLREQGWPDGKAPRPVVMGLIRKAARERMKEARAGPMAEANR